MSADMALIADLNDAHAATPTRSRNRPKPKCPACLVGDCHLCVRVACFHRCPDPRRVGVASPAAGVGHDHREGK